MLRTTSRDKYTKIYLKVATKSIKHFINILILEFMQSVVVYEKILYLCTRNAYSVPPIMRDIIIRNIPVYTIRWQNAITRNISTNWEQ